jgi:hypothetical protein
MLKKLFSRFSWKPTNATATGTNIYKVVCDVHLQFPEGTHTIQLTRFTKKTKDKATAVSIVQKEFENALKHSMVTLNKVSETIQNS